MEICCLHTDLSQDSSLAGEIPALHITTYMTITYNPNNGDIYIVQLEKTLYKGKGPSEMTLLELIKHLNEKVEDGAI